MSKSKPKTMEFTILGAYYKSLGISPFNVGLSEKGQLMHTTRFIQNYLDLDSEKSSKGIIIGKLLSLNVTELFQPTPDLHISIEVSPQKRWSSEILKPVRTIRCL